MDGLFTIDALIALLTLTAMEVVLGVDNVVFIAILAARLPATEQPLARRLGLTLALLIRIGLLLTISWIMGLTTPLFHVRRVGVSGRNLILLGGGLFLMAKSTREIYDKEERAGHGVDAGPDRRVSFAWVLVQILLLDIVFSLDSVITAVGMVDQVPIMIVAMVLAMLVMLASAGPIGSFVERHPSVKILALSFLLLVGVLLVAEATGAHLDRGYVYFAMAFSLFVEMLNMRYRRRKTVRA